MNSNELRAERIRRGKTVKEIASLLGITYDAYLKKENGKTMFNPNQIILVSNYLHLSPEMINVIFFDRMLPIG